MQLRCGWDIQQSRNCKFPTECDNEGIFLIGQYLAKTWGKKFGGTFQSTTLRIFKLYNKLYKKAYLLLLPMPQRKKEVTKILAYLPYL